MRIIVPIKQVYDPDTVRVSRSRGVLDTREAHLIFNRGDRFALEEGLQLRQDHGGSVVAITLGPAEAEEILREALAMGVDEAVLLTDDAFSGVDVSAAVMIVGEGIKRLGAYDLVLTGRRAMGDGTGEFGPRLAGYLELPQVTKASRLSLDDGKLSARRTLAGGYVTLSVDLPAVVSIEEDTNDARYPSLPGCIAAYDESVVSVWGAKDLDLTADNIAECKTTEVRSTEAGPERERGRIISGEAEDAASELLAELRRRGLLST
jgi:electron transfer flavoprotein beta subunit